MVTKKLCRGNSHRPVGSSVTFCQLCNAPGHCLQNCKVNAGAEMMMRRLGKIQSPTGSTSSPAATKSVHGVGKDLGNQMDAWKNRDGLVDHICDETTMLVMDHQSKQFINHNIAWR